MTAPGSDSAGIRQIVRALKAKGAERIAFYDEDFGKWESLTGKTENAIVKSLMDYDEVVVRFAKGTKDSEGYDRISIHLVFGNGEPMDLIADFSMFREDAESFSTAIETLIDDWIARLDRVRNCPLTDTMRGNEMAREFTCNDCSFTTADIHLLANHSCDVAMNGGNCEDMMTVRQPKSS